MTTQESIRLGNYERQREGLISKTYPVLLDYLVTAVSALREPVRKQTRARIIKSPQGRIEDDQIEIDSLGDALLQEALQKHLLRALVYSEISAYGSTDPEIYGVIDPFDNSSEHRKRLDTPPYTVLSFYDLKGSPLVAGVGDPLRNRLFINRGNQNYLIDLQTGEEEMIFPSSVKRIDDDRFVLATYDCAKRYFTPFKDHFTQLIEGMSQKGRKYSHGGAFVYAYLASGAVSAYVMFDEPRSEIDPGLPLALAAGCTVVSVNPDGTFENYRFVPGRQRIEDEIPFFIAACTPQIRDEIIGYYLNSLKQ